MPKIPPPSSGWSFREVIDSRDEPATCDWCNKRGIRWLHVIEHPDHHDRLGVGGCCAARLCDDYDAVAMEREARNRANRWRNFSLLWKWKDSKYNPRNICRTVHVPGGSVKVTIYWKEGIYGVCLKQKRGQPAYPREWSTTQKGAIRVAFEYVEQLRQTIVQEAAL